MICSSPETYEGSLSVACPHCKVAPGVPCDATTLRKWYSNEARKYEKADLLYAAQRRREEAMRVVHAGRFDRWNANRMRVIRKGAIS